MCDDGWSVLRCETPFVSRRCRDPSSPRGGRKGKPTAMAKLTHFDDEGRARMVDVSDKAETAREAVATGFVRMSGKTLKLATSGGGKKGDVAAVAEIAGVM